MYFRIWKIFFCVPFLYVWARRQRLAFRQIGCLRRWLLAGFYLSVLECVCALLLLKSWVMYKKCKILSAYVDCSCGKETEIGKRVSGSDLFGLFMATTIKYTLHRHCYYPLQATNNDNLDRCASSRYLNTYLYNKGRTKSGPKEIVRSKAICLPLL